VKRPLDDRLPKLVESFFRDYLQRTRGASSHTIRAYGDALSLFFRYLADAHGRSVAELQLDDLREEPVLAFLAHLEVQRGNTVATRNGRLSAIQSFVGHLLRHDPTRAEQYHRILALPSKRASRRIASYLEPEEVRVLLAQPDRATSLGQRDHALLLFLYNTGARVSEALDVRMGDLELLRPRQVRLRGKGGKERFCPLWAQTAAALRPLAERRAVALNDVVFCNARCQRLTRDGVAYILEKYVARACRDRPELSQRKVTPHVLRHSCAVALLQAGIDVTVIRDYLGHASVATTSRYIATNLEMKRHALEAFWKRAGIASPRTTPWRPRPDLLAFLRSL
jgi:integrase/recombinase XerD